jgi:nitronate monooxygenase
MRLHIDKIEKNISLGRNFLGTSKAFISSPMAGGITCPTFVAAISNNGGLGSFATGYLKPYQVKESIIQIQKLTPFNFAANVFVPQKIDVNTSRIKDMQSILHPYYEELNLQMPDLDADNTEEEFEEILDILYKAKVPFLSCVFGCLSTEVIENFHNIGTKIIGTATTVKEAQHLADQGCDAIVAQGIEAGGHRGSFIEDALTSGTGLISLIPAIRNASINIPVFAAGGIASADQMLACVLLGANGCTVGTALLLSKESCASTLHKNILLEETNSTHLTSNITGKMARALRRSELDIAIGKFLLFQIILSFMH